MAVSTTPEQIRRVPRPVRAAGRRPGPGTGREGLAGYVFLSPWLVGLLGITAVPMLLSLYLSFTNYDVLTPWSEVDWVGLANYRRMFTADPSYWHAVRVTVTFAVVAVPLKLAAALGVALLLNRAWRGVGLFRGLFYLPSLLGGSVALAIVWRNMFGGDGAVNSFLALFGIHGEAWVNDPDWALETLMVLAIWQFGAPMVIFLAGLQAIPADLYEAATLDGATRWQQFRPVTLPMLRPTLLFGGVVTGIGYLQLFEEPFVMTQGGPLSSTLSVSFHIYNQFGFGNYGYAAAASYVLFLAIVALSVVQFRLLGDRSGR